MKKVILINTIAAFFLSLSVSAQEGFGPWNPGVTIGDSKVHSEDLKKATKIIESQATRKESSSFGKNQHKNFFSGFSGGAYFLIRFFQIVISPQDGPNCRYRPVCSHYGRQSVAKHGALVGSMMAGDRIIRCNPYNPPGHDPVPEKLTDD